MAAKTKTKVLNLAHFSMQTSDTDAQKRRDAVKIFDGDYDAITGTESGLESTRRILRVAAHNAGYKFHVARSNWVCVKKSLLVPGTYKTGHKMLVPTEKVEGPGHDLHITWAQGEIKNIGLVSFVAGHFAIRGRPGWSGRYRVNLGANKEYAEGIDKVADRLAKGSNIVFYGGDQNMVDRTTDTFFGGSLTSAWDELGKYEDTGHGNIDVIASHDSDGRVKAKYIRALDDREQFMFTDHYPVEAGFTVKLKPGA